MKTKTIEVYEYSELSDEAKRVASSWWLESGIDQEFAWDSMKEDAENVGIKLTAWEYGRTCEGKLVESFSSVLGNILKDHGDMCETYKTAKEYKDKLDVLTDEQEDEREELEADFLLSILEDYRIAMDKECDYQQSEEYIAEIMEANDYEFTKNGKRI